MTAIDTAARDRAAHAGSTRARITRPDLSVIVVTHNRSALALQTLRSARAAVGNLRVQWLVVDSGSTDDTPEAIERTWEDVLVERLENVGFAVANNRALARASGRYILLLNPDCVVTEGTFEALIRTLDQRPQVGIASVIQRAPDGSLQYSIRRYPSPWLALGEAIGAARWLRLRHWREEEARIGRYGSEESVDWLVGAFLIVRAEAVRQVGPLDERFFLYSEEIDWCYRFRQAGWDVCHLPQMVVTHHTSASYAPDLMAQLSCAKVLFARKHYPPWRSFAIRGALVLRHLLRAAGGSALAMARPSWQTRAAAEKRALAVLAGRAAPPFGAARLDRGRSDESYYQHERYLGPPARSRQLSAYYAVKPLIPRSLQLRIRRLHARRRARRTFPAWPIEPILVDRRHERIRAELRRKGVDRIPIVGLWPHACGAAWILTHDVEGPLGVQNIPRVLEIEQRHGLVSSWNFVAEAYPTPAHTFELLREAGCEIGLHGVRHDGKLFQSRERFEAELGRIRRYMAEWGAVGFRSPATHRRADWMHELGCLYDSSFPDTDPFEPQPGGCCSILPFMLGDVVELPITLVQDHTLWEILRQSTIELWRRKSEWVIANHGLVSLITHPDYLTTPARLEMYDELLAYLAAQADCWHALPRDVATWWRARGRMRCEPPGAPSRVAPDPEGRASVWWARDDGDRIVFDRGLDVAR